MLAKAHRLKTRADFARTYQRGLVKHGSYIVVRSRRNNLAHNRYGIVVSKKISKSAVVRNRIKRQISEIIRTSAIADKGCDYVLVVKSQITSASTITLKQDIIRVLSDNPKRNYAKPTH